MKSKLSKILSIFSVLTFISVFFPFQTQAAGSIYLSPAVKSVSQGSTFSISVRVSSTNAIDTVQANLSYDVSKLTFLSINTSSSAFDIQAESIGGGGSVKIGRGLAGSIIGDKLVATVNFKALAASGSTTINFVGGSEADSAGNPVVTATAGATINFTAAPQQAPQQPAPPLDTKAPAITEVKVLKIGLDFVTVSWITDEAATSTVDYGTDKGYFLSQTSTDLVTKHEITINSKFFEPAKTYHLQVKSKDGSGNQAVGKDISFTTTGYSVSLKIVDDSNKPIKNAKVQLSGLKQELTTDFNGTVVFQDVAPGDYLVIISSNNQTKTERISVKDAGTKQITTKDKDGKEMTQVKPVAQNFEVKVAGMSESKSFTILIALLLSILILIASVLVSVKIWKERGLTIIQKDPKL